MMTKFQGLIFDLNGVLWWDGHLQEQSWRQFSATIRGTPLTEAEMDVHVYGRNGRHTLEYLTGRTVVGEELQQLVEQKERIYRQLCLDQGKDFKLSPGAVELLAFSVAHHIPHTIATASGKANLDFLVRCLRLDAWFDVAKVVYDDGTRPGKPAPDFYLQAVRNLGLEPAQCVVIEDSASGIQAARAAGIGYTVALGPVHRQEQLARLGASQVVETLQQVPKEQLFIKEVWREHPSP
jgi:beta-phosphoglucomutase-like phosphatase (HAD superfamily)